jgi:hypothetical protein
VVQEATGDLQVTWTNHSIISKTTWTTMRNRGTDKLVIAAINSPESHAKARATQKRKASFKYLIHERYYQFYSDYAYNHGLARATVYRLFRVEPHNFTRLVVPIENMTGRHCPEGIVI